VILIVPPYEHIHFDASFNAGILPINTVGTPGIHGPAVIGVHGMGVNTPLAAEVADAVAGFAMEVHVANGIMFTNGT
jgi:hypothetical protein